MKTGTIVIVVILSLTAVIVGWMIFKARAQPPAMSGDTQVAPSGGSTTNNKYLGFVSDVLNIGKQGVDLYGSWNNANKSMA